MAARVVTMSEEDFVALSSDCGGVCLACGEHVHGGVEPDACGYKCGGCGEPQVYGAEEALMMGRIEIK